MNWQPRHRLALAVEVHEPARAALAHALAPLRATYLGVNWVPDEHWYVDLCEFGALEDREADQVDAETDALAGALPQLSLRLDGGIGVLSSGTLFAGVEESLAFAELQSAVVSHFDERGPMPTRTEALPGCVIGRVPGGGGLPAASLRSFRGPLVAWTARRLVVVCTRLRLGGVVVEERSVRPFGRPVATRS